MSQRLGISFIPDADAVGAFFGALIPYPTNRTASVKADDRQILYDSKNTRLQHFGLKSRQTSAGNRHKNTLFFLQKKAVADILFQTYQQKTLCKGRFLVQAKVFDRAGNEDFILSEYSTFFHKKNQQKSFAKSNKKAKFAPLAGILGLQRVEENE